MSNRVINVRRRDVLKTAAATLAIPTFIPSSVLASPGHTGANGKIRIGIIGTGIW